MVRMNLREVLKKRNLCQFCYHTSNCKGYSHQAKEDSELNGFRLPLEVLDEFPWINRNYCMLAS
jgi:hypothetical protein